MEPTTLGRIEPNEWAIKLLNVVKSVRDNIHLTDKRAIIYTLVLNVTIIAFMTMVHVAFGRFTFEDTCSLSIIFEVVGTLISVSVNNLCKDYGNYLDADIKILSNIIEKKESLSYEDRQKSANVMNNILKDITHYVRINLFIVLSYILMIIVCFASILITSSVI